MERLMFVFDTYDEAKAALAKIDASRGFPKEGGTQSAAEVIALPDGRYAFDGWADTRGVLSVFMAETVSLPEAKGEE